MAVDVYNPLQVRAFKEKAIASGYSPDEVDSFVSTQVQPEGNRFREQQRIQKESSAPIADTMMQKGGLGNTIGGAVLQPFERIGRWAGGSAAGLGLAQNALLNPDEEARQAAAQMLKEGKIPFLNQKLGKSLTSSDPKDLEWAKESAKVGLDVGSMAAPVGKGGKAFLTEGARGAVSSAARDNATPESVLAGAGIGSIVGGAAANIPNILNKVRGVKDPAKAGLDDVIEVGGKKTTWNQLNADQKLNTDYPNYLERLNKPNKSSTDTLLMDALAKKWPDDPRFQQHMFGGFASKADEIANKAVTSAKQQAMDEKMNLSVKNMVKNFTVPTKLAGKDRLDVIGTARKLNEYGVGLDGDLNNMKIAADTVTGENGILAAINRDAISQVKKPVNVSSALDDAFSTAASKAQLDEPTQVRVLEVVNRELQKAQDPSQVFDTIKSLERLGYAEQAKSTYLTKNPVAEDIADIYLAAAKRLESELGNTVDDAAIIQTYKSPVVLDALRGVSPKLADDFMKANTVGELRRLQSPFVRLSQILDQTDQAQFSQMSKAASAASRGGIMERVAGATVGPAMDAVNDAAIKPISQRLGAGVANTLDNVGNAFAGAKTGLNTAVGGLANASEGVVTNPMTQQTLGSVTRGAMQNQPQQPQSPVPNAVPGQQGMLPRDPSMALQPQTPSVLGDSTMPTEPAVQQNVMDRVTPEILYQAMLEDPQNAEIYKTILDMKFKQQALDAKGNTVKPLNARQQQLKFSADSGLESLQRVEDMLINTQSESYDPTVVYQSLIPSMREDYTADIQNIQSMAKNLNKATGAPVPMPDWTDDEAEMKRKLGILKNLFAMYSQGQVAASDGGLGNPEDIQFEEY